MAVACTGLLAADPPGRDRGQHPRRESRVGEVNRDKLDERWRKPQRSRVREFKHQPEGREHEIGKGDGSSDGGPRSFRSPPPSDDKQRGDQCYDQPRDAECHSDGHVTAERERGRRRGPRHDRHATKPGGQTVETERERDHGDQRESQQRVHKRDVASREQQRGYGHRQGGADRGADRRRDRRAWRSRALAQSDGARSPPGGHREAPVRLCIVASGSTMPAVQA